MNILFYTFLFLLLCSIFVYGYFFYPFGLYLLSIFVGRERRFDFGDISQCKFDVVLSVRDETSRIKRRIDNLLSLPLSSAINKVIVIDDGSSDSTSRIVERYPKGKVVIVKLRSNSGKPFALNCANIVSRKGIVYYIDARQVFDQKALVSILGALSDARVGAVSGQLLPSKSRHGIGAGIDTYWRIERFIRRVESKLGACIGCTGAMYAVKKKLYQPLPSDTILDDVVTPLEVLKRNFFVKYDIQAIAYDEQPLTAANESRRKSRTIAGNFQMLFRYPENFSMGFAKSFMYYSHKVSRVLAPFTLPIIFVMPLLLLHYPVFLYLFYLQLLFYFLVLISFFIKQSFFSKISAFAFMNLMVFSAFYKFLRGAYRSGW